MMHWMPFLVCSAIVAVVHAIVIVTAARSLCNATEKTGRELADDRAMGLSWAAGILLVTSLSLIVPAMEGWDGSPVVLIAIIMSCTFGMIMFPLAYIVVSTWVRWIIDVR